MIAFMLLAVATTNETPRRDWIEQLREGDRLAAENRYAEAESAYAVARNQAEQLGTDQIPLAIALNHVGHYYLSLGRLRDAERVYEKAFRMAGRVFDATSDRGVKFAVDLCSVYMELGQFSHAESLVRRLLRSDALSATNRAVLLAELASALVCKQSS